jgi:hypothetical protein
MPAKTNRRTFNLGLLGVAGSLMLQRALPAKAAYGAPGSFSGAPAALRVNGARLNDHLKALSEFGKR